MSKPIDLRIRMYNVGFGDCFLLSFRYPDASRHLLVDFGTTGQPKGSEGGLLKRVASDIAATVGREPFAVVATHRHADHIAGFDPGKNGKGPGAIIASLRPKFVIQPWTEDPKLPTDAKTPRSRKPSARQAMALRRTTLERLHAIAAHAVSTAPRMQKVYATRQYAGELGFIGQDNLKNFAAVDQLRTMAPNEYVFAEKKSARLTRFLPGVAVDILGPPTVKQHDGVRRQRQRDPDEFWTLRAASLGLESTALAQGAPALDAPSVRGRDAPESARWLIRRQRAEHADGLLQLVRSLDSALNNTSVILLFRCGKQKLLFPGDAQIENWEYALGSPKLRAKLQDVTVYKVGHHGSLNATPLSLWKDWFPRGGPVKAAAKKMVSLLSTLDEKHGSKADNTEVPRRRLVTALGKKTKLRTTLKAKTGYIDTVVDF